MATTKNVPEKVKAENDIKLDVESDIIILNTNIKAIGAVIIKHFIFHKFN